MATGVSVGRELHAVAIGSDSPGLVSGNARIQDMGKSSKNAGKYL
jgi:hypothetical protein